MLKTWLVGHGMDPLLLWSDEQSCCPYWHPATMDHFMPHDVEVTCIQDYGIGHIRFQSAGLHGDINDASERMDMLTGVRSFVVNNNADLTGNFPTFLTKLPDLFSIGLSHTGLEGPMPDLRGLPNLVVLNTDGTEFSGPLPPSKKLQDTGLSYSAPSFLSCSISSEHSELCWLYDKSEYDPKCLDSNPSIRTCGTAAPVMTSMVSSVASPAMSATTFNASSPAAKLMPTSSSISSQPSSSPAPSVAFLTDASNNNSTVGSEPSQAYLGGLIGGVIGGILIFILVAVFLIRKLNKPNATVSVASAPSKSHKNHSHGHHGKLKRSLSAKGSSLSVDTIATAQSQSFADSLVSPTTMMGRHA